MIRKYNINDIDAIVELENKTIGSSLGKDTLVNYLENEMIYIFVYEEEGMILGYISLAFDGYSAEMYNFAVLPDYQNKKIGTKILEYIVNYFKDKNCDSIILDVKESNLKAIHVYEKFNFKRISIRKAYYKNGENALIMQMHIN